MTASRSNIYVYAHLHDVARHIALEFDIFQEANLSTFNSLYLAFERFNTAVPHITTGAKIIVSEYLIGDGYSEWSSSMYDYLREKHCLIICLDSDEYE